MPLHERPALVLAILALMAPAGCSDDEPAKVNVGPTGDPSLAIVDPAPGACIAIGAAADATIPVTVAPKELYLRPPGTCGAYKQCGHLVLRVNGVENNRGSARIIDVVFEGKIADRYADLTLSIEVLSDAETPILNQAGEPVVASISVTTAESAASCGAGAGGAGGGGTGGAGGAGGGTGGAGGAGGGTGGAGGAGGGTGGAGGAAGAGGGAAGAGGA
jgi:hypothetical protein